MNSPTPEITISPLGEAADCAAVVAMIVEASRDAALCAATYLPANLDATGARAFCVKGDGFVVRDAGAPVGVVRIHHLPRPGDGVQLPAGCVETESWLLPRFLGRGILRRAWPLIAQALAQRFDVVAAVCWEENRAALNSLRARGFDRLGRSWWSDGDCAGFCEVWICDLRTLTDS